jgi:hypothetical protein
MTWYSFVFPNTAMVTATQAIGKTFEARSIQIFGTVMGVLLVVVWPFVFGMMARAFRRKRLLWPGIDGSHKELEEITALAERATAEGGGRRKDRRTIWRTS